MSNPTEYRRQAWRDPESALPILVRPGRIEYAMSEKRALMLLRELDEALHPRGEPGPGGARAAPMRRTLISIMDGIGFALDQLATPTQLETMAEKWLQELDEALHPSVPR